MIPVWDRSFSCLSHVKKSFCVCVVSCFSSVFWSMPSTAVYVCAVFIAPGIMPCSHVKGVAEPERASGGNRWLQSPLPLVSSLPVCLSPSLLHSFHGWSVLLAGRKACCFDASSCDQRGDPALGLCRLRSRALPSVSLLFWRPHGSGITAVYVSGSGQISQGVPRTYKVIHTPTI